MSQGGYVQSWLSADYLAQNFLVNTATVNEANVESWRYSYDVYASLALPWGRVRDVTGVQRVQYVEERLLRDRVLSGRLEARTRQRLADLFYTESKFSLVHDLPDRYFWSEFEQILREDPAVRADRLDAYAVYHAADPLVVARGFGRRAGYSVGPVITLVHANDLRRLDAHFRDRFFQADTLVAEFQHSSYLREEHDDQEARAGAEVVIEQPIGLRWHLYGFGTATSDLRALDRDLQIQSTLALRFWEGERWYWDTGASQFRRTGTELPSSTLEWWASYWTAVSYYLEDHVSIEFGLRGSQYQYAFGEYQRYAEVRIGLSYRSGSLTAPGLFAPVRPGS